MDDINTSDPNGVSDPNGNQHCSVQPVSAHGENTPVIQKHQPNIYGGQLMGAPVCSEPYPCGGLLGDCQTIAPLDHSWMSAECYPSRAYDLPLSQTPMTNLSQNHLDPTGPLASHSHHQELEEPAAVCVKAERTYTPDGGRAHHHPPSTSVYEDSFHEDPTKYRSLRPHSTPATLLWLDENYEMAEGVCIPRNALYLHYVDFCAKNAMQPVNAASFGKIIRQQFPALTTRRLGTRGQSRYHYYGIAIREHSPYFEPTYSKKSGETADTGGKRQSHSNSAVTTTSVDNNNVKTEHFLNYPQVGGAVPANSLGLGSPSQRVKLTAVLPDFPTLRGLNITSAVDREQVSSFLTMYRTHSQRVLDTILAMNLDQVRVHLQHFWFGIPQHVASSLGCPVLVNLVALCDFALYKTVQGLLLPSLVQPLPESFIRMVDIFTQEYESWLERALVGFPKALQHVKIEVGKRFVCQLRRRLSVNQLSQAAKMLLLNRQVVDQMVQDWRDWRRTHSSSPPICSAGRSGVLLDSLSFQLLPPGLSSACGGNTTTAGMNIADKERTSCPQETLICVLAELESCLETSTSLETLLLWMDSVIEKYVSGVSRPAAKRSKGTAAPRAPPQSQRDLCCGFYRTWRICSQRIFRDLTVKGTTYYASFQLLRVLFDDYVLLSLEGVLGDCLVREMQENIANNRTLDVEHINALELMNTPSPHPQTSLDAASPKVQLSSHVTALSVHPGAAGAYIEPPKSVQLCALSSQMPTGSALLEKAKHLRRVSADECSLEPPLGHQTTQTNPPVAIFYETTNCYAGVTSVIQQTTNIITTTATTATAGSLYGTAEVLEAGGADLGCTGASQAGSQCLIISGEPSASGGHHGSVEWAAPHPPPGPPSHAHYAATAHHYRQTSGVPPAGGPNQNHHLHHFNQ